MASVTNKIKDNPFLVASLFYLVGTGVGQGVIFLSNSVFTRIMTQADYGLYSNYYAYVSIFSGVIGLNLFMSLTTGYIDYKDRYKEFRSSVLLLSTICAAILSMLAFVVILLLGKPDVLTIAIFIAIHSFGFFVINYYVYSLNYQNIYKKKAIYLALPNVCQVVFSIALIVLINNKSTFALRMIGSTAGIALFGIIAYFCMGRSYRLHRNNGYWKYAVRISIPTILGSISSLLMQQCDKIMITSMCGAEENAIYSFVYVVGFIPQAVMQATNGAWESWLFRNAQCGKRKVGNAQRLYTLFMLLVIIIMFAITPDVIKLMSPSSYWRFEYTIPFLLSSGTMFLCSLYSALFMYNKMMTPISVIVSLAAIVNILLNALCIPLYGGVAAAYTSLISQIIMLMCYILYGERKQINILSNSITGVALLLFIFVSIVYIFLLNKTALRYCVFGIFGIIVGSIMIKHYLDSKQLDL